ncbi:MAG: DUF3394 domain-containing protein, partial [Aurantimonas coralicida]
PPVGLASFAAAALSGGDPIKTGAIAFFYSLRTAALPFLFIFNTDLLLINVDIPHGIFIAIVATIAMLLFAAATQGWFLTRNRAYESVALLLVAFTLFRPGFWMDMVVAPYSERPGSEVVEAAAETPQNEPLRLRIDYLDAFGEPSQRSVELPLPAGATGEERLQNAGLELIDRDGKTIIDNVAFGSAAEKAGLDWDQEITLVRTPTDQPSKYWMFIPALAVLGLIVWAQRRRRPADETHQGQTAVAA